MFDDEIGVRYPSREQVQERLSQSIALDADAKIRASLVAMGWMPPDQVDKVRRVICDAHEAAVRRGQNVHWQLLEEELRVTHDNLPSATTP